MLRFAYLLSAALALAACAPGASTAVPATAPVVYAADREVVFDAVVQAITAAPALLDSSGWIIAQSDRQGGFVRTDTVVSTPWTFWSPRRTESLSVVVSDDGAGRAQVVIQRTSGAEALATHILASLDGSFERQ